MADDAGSQLLTTIEFEVDPTTGLEQREPCAGNGQLYQQLAFVPEPVHGQCMNHPTAPERHSLTIEPILEISDLRRAFVRLSSNSATSLGGVS